MVKSSLTHRERIEACLAGVKPDRLPLALWRHFPVADQTPDTLADATLDYQDKFDFDLVKVTPASSYCVKDWGLIDEWKGNPEGTREFTHHVINSPDDWVKLKPLDPKAGGLGAQLQCLRLITNELGAATPVIQTIFNPLSQAKNLVGKADLALHLRLYPDALHAALEVITNTTIEFIEAASRTGIAGVFYAVQHAQYGLLSETEYQEFGVPYDLKILQATRGMWLNMLHIHGEHVMFNLLASYPAESINWHDMNTPPSLEEAQLLYPGVVCGGLRRDETMLLGTPGEVTREARAAYDATSGVRHILGTGCVMMTTTPECNIWAARHAVEQF